MAQSTVKPDTTMSSTTLTTPSSSTVFIKKETMTKKKTPKTVTKNQVEVPIFLRKTYHMIDTCDSKIASWSDDGETFVVKQPKIFESTIIPQFFKHSKFSSFVRQLNFYGFRKIKYSDTIKIDAQLEAETANYWRFRHEHFLRGRPELLMEIKRSNSQSQEQKADGKGKGEEKVGKSEVKGIKSDVETLKDRIAKMSEEIENLTGMVKDITMKEKEAARVEQVDVNVEVGQKRRKVTEYMDHDDVDTLTQDIPVKEEMDGIEFTPTALFPSTQPKQELAYTAPSRPIFNRQESTSSAVSDDAFVDDLLNVFGDNAEQDTDIFEMERSIVPEEATSMSAPLIVQEPQPQTTSRPNEPDPALMGKLSDALTVLPKDVQEMLVNKLINTITSSDALKAHIDAVNSEVKKEEDAQAAFQKQNSEMIPLAAATLTAIISQYSAVMKNDNRVKTSSIPVIPIHA